MDNKIQVKSLYKSFGANNVLNGIDLSIPKGKSLVILGGSGTGKSVLIKAIIGLIMPDSGSILIDNVETIGCSKAYRRKIMEKCGFLFQGGALFDSLTIGENITFFAEKLFKLSKYKRKELAISKLLEVGLTEKVLDLYPAELSGGMQKRASLARAICSNPNIVFFDEPTTGLDPIMTNVINELIIKVRKELGATTITITHDIQSACTIAENVAYMHQGKIMWTGSIEEMKNTTHPYMHQFRNGLSSGPINPT